MQIVDGPIFYKLHWTSIDRWRNDVYIMVADRMRNAPLFQILMENDWVKAEESRYKREKTAIAKIVLSSS